MGVAIRVYKAVKSDKITAQNAEGHTVHLALLYIFILTERTQMCYTYTQILQAWGPKTSISFTLFNQSVMVRSV